MPSKETRGIPLVEESEETVPFQILKSELKVELYKKGIESVLFSAFADRVAKLEADNEYKEAKEKAAVETDFHFKENLKLKRKKKARIDETIRINKDKVPGYQPAYHDIKLAIERMEEAAKVGNMSENSVLRTLKNIKQNGIQMDGNPRIEMPPIKARIVFQGKHVK